RAPPIPSAQDGRYHGETLDLNKTDLGQHLELLARKGKLARQVVLHLHGSGQRLTSPFRVQETDLVLYFEPPVGNLPPLVLMPKPATSAGRAALIEVEDGSLEVQGGGILFDNSRQAPLPRHLIRVKRGDLRLQTCVFQGALARAPECYQGL